MTDRYIPLEVPATPARVLDLNSLKRGFFYFGVFMMVCAPFAQDPLALSVGAAVPWLVLQLIGKPGMPTGVVYILLFQWLQIFARVLQSMVDGEAMAAGLFGPTVARAYWYMLASVVVIALALRFTLGNLKPPTNRDRMAHLEWRATDIFTLYVLTLVLAVACRFAVQVVPGLDQPLDALSKMKIVLLFILFSNILMSGRNGNLLWATFAAEVLMGFGGLLSDFRGVFIYLAIAAVASRIPLRGTTIALGMLCAGFLLLLALFWSAVKMDYREFATGGMDSQALSVGLDERLGFLGDRIVSPDDIDWNQAAYQLLVRLAYTDIFGSVIGVQESSSEQVVMRQWQDAIDHVTRPRFLFPDKAALSDTEVYVRLARGNASEQIRLGTSISVGYMAENFVDLGFPGMLIGVFVIGALFGLVIRFFMRMQVPWALREGVVLGFAVSVTLTGVEMSLPKIIGATVMFFLVYVLVARFGFPLLLRWLNGRSAVSEPQLS